MKKFFICFVLVLSTVFFASCEKKGSEISTNYDTKASQGGEQSENVGEVGAEEKRAEKSEILSCGNSLPEKLFAFTPVNEYFCDLNGDGEDEKVVLYTDAQKNGGELVLNDGNSWSFVVFDQKNNLYYNLFDEYVQLGNVYFQVADFIKKDNAEPAVLLYKMSGSGIEIFKYTSNGKNGFFKEVIYDTSKESEGGINLKYSSVSEA